MAQIHFDSAEDNPQYNGVRDVSPEEVQKNMAHVKVIDVRQLDEYHGELGHIRGAELIPLDTLGDVWTDREHEPTYVFVCRSGGRSGRAAAHAHALGFKHVYNMKGGMMLWNDLRLPTTTE